MKSQRIKKITKTRSLMGMEKLKTLMRRTLYMTQPLKIATKLFCNKLAKWCKTVAIWVPRFTKPIPRLSHWWLESCKIWINVLSLFNSGLYFSMKILSWNVRGVNHASKLRRIKSVLDETHPD